MIFVLAKENYLNFQLCFQIIYFILNEQAKWRNSRFIRYFKLNLSRVVDTLNELSDF